MKFILCVILSYTTLLKQVYGQLFGNKTFAVDMDQVLKMTGDGGFILKGHIANMSIGYQ